MGWLRAGVRQLPLKERTREESSLASGLVTRSRRALLSECAPVIAHDAKWIRELLPETLTHDVLAVLIQHTILLGEAVFGDVEGARRCTGRYALVKLA